MHNVERGTVGGVTGEQPRNGQARPPEAGSRSLRSDDASALLALVRDLEEPTRAALAEATRLARGTLSARLEALLAAGYLIEETRAASSGGRRPGILALNPDAGLLGLVDVGGSRTRVGIADLSGTLRGVREQQVDVASGPQAILGWAERTIDELVAEVSGQLAAVTVGLPGPVDHAAGTVISPPIMRGWDGVPIGATFAARGVPVVVENDVNLMTLAEHRHAWPDQRHLLVVKLGTGVGAGLIVDGRLVRGERGAAGDLGHIQHDDHAEEACRCGQRGCVEAVAGGWALVRYAQDAGLTASTTRDVAALARGGNPVVLARVREAGAVVGRAVADAVSLLNPGVVVLTGDLVQAGDLVLAGVREAVYQRSLPLATRHLRIETGRLGEDAGLHGAAIVALDAALRPDQVSRRLALAT